MKTYTLKSLDQTVQTELDLLARLTKSPIQVDQVITVTINNDELAPIVERVLGVGNTQYSDPRPKETIGGTELGVRICEHCQGEYHPIRKDQKFCTRPDCKKARQIEATKAAREKKTEVAAEPEPAPLSPGLDQ